MVVLLADLNQTYNIHMADLLNVSFSQFICDGFLQVIRPPSTIYPNFDMVKRTYIDGLDRLKWRAKQNIDFAYLFNYSKNISEYYLQLEDDVVCASNFMTFIQREIARHNAIINPPWFMLEFCRLGFIGKLFRSSDLPWISRFLLKSFDTQPGDLMLGKMLKEKKQPKPIHSKHSLFQHNGKFSSLHNKLMPSIDEHFKDADHVVLQITQLPKGDNPEANIYTNFEGVPGYPVYAAYDGNASSFYWAKRVKMQNIFQLSFIKSHNFSRILISTGDEKRKKDALFYSSLFVATLEPLIKPRYLGKCGTFKRLTDFVEGEIDTKPMGVDVPKNIVCLKIVPKLTSHTWVKIREIVLLY